MLRICGGSWNTRGFFACGLRAFTQLVPCQWTPSPWPGESTVIWEAGGVGTKMLVWAFPCYSCHSLLYLSSPCLLCLSSDPLSDFSSLFSCIILSQMWAFQKAVSQMKSFYFLLHCSQNTMLSKYLNFLNYLDIQPLILGGTVSWNSSLSTKRGTDSTISEVPFSADFPGIIRIHSSLFSHMGLSGVPVTFPKEIYPKQCEIKRRH